LSGNLWKQNPLFGRDRKTERLLLNQQNDGGDDGHATDYDSSQDFHGDS